MNDTTVDPVTAAAQKAFGYFFPGDVNDPRVNPEVRKRIALQLMARQRAVPKNIGEGINAIGEAIGDVRMQNRMLEQDVTDNQRLLDAGQAVRGVGAAAAPPVGGAPVQTAMVPPQEETNAIVPPVTRSTAAAGAPSPLPPDDPTRFASTGGVPPPRMPEPPNTTNSLLATPGPNPIPTNQGLNDPRARAAFILAARQRGIMPPSPPETGVPPANPTEAGAQAPADVLAGGGDPLDANAQMPPQHGIRTAPAYAPPSFEPLTPVQRRAIERAQAEPWNAPLQKLMQDIYDQEEVGRKQRQAVRDDIRAKNDPKYRAELEKAQNEARKGREPELRKREDVEDGAYYDAATGTYRKPRVEGADPDAKPTYIPKTEAQGKAFSYYGRSRLGHEGLTPEAENILASSPLQGALVKSLPSQVSDKYREAYNNSEHFVQAFVRSLSGANIPDTELEKEARTMIPRYGDSPAQIEAKRLQRAMFVAGQATIIGDRGVKAAEWEMKKLRGETAAKKQLEIFKEMEGKERIPGKVYTNKKTGAKRVWNGTFWEEH